MALRELVSSAHSWIYAEATAKSLSLSWSSLHSPSDPQEHQAGSRLHDMGHIQRETLSIID